MEKLLISFFAIILSVGGFAQQFNLGNVSFATDSVWVISGNGITQIWSDAVQTDSCSNKTTFDGGDWKKIDEYSFEYNFKIDCRSNPGQKGDLFSWRAVNEFEDMLCPFPWRVPTRQDFIDLDIALGGNGGNRMFIYDNDNRMVSPQFITRNYLNRWGGSYGGNSHRPRSDEGYRIMFVGSSAGYWSSSEYSNAVVYFMHFSSYGHGSSVDPQAYGEKNTGYSLRCVRDN